MHSQIRRRSSEWGWEVLLFLAGLAACAVWFDWGVTAFWMWGREAFAARSSYGDVLPLAAAVAFALTLRLFFQRPGRVRSVVVLLLLYLNLRYIAWRFFATLNFDNGSDGALSLTFFLLELTVFINNLLFYLQTLAPMDRSREADELSSAVRSGAFQPTVDIFIPTYNEPIEMLRRSIIGAQSIEYPNKRVFLLDDGARPEAEALAHELNCEYFARHARDHAKAGNINYALQRTSGDLVVVFDADFVASENFLERTVGFFQNPKVGLVQTPQHFYNEDLLASNLGVRLANEQDLFFRYIQPGRDRTNSIICHGSCFVVRRSALEAIGGMPTETITEDILLSIRLQSRGWRLVNLDEVLSAGASPESVSAYFTQRLRWAQGAIQLLFCGANPLTMRGLSAAQRLFVLTSISYWFTVATRIFYLTLPIGHLLFGWNPVRASLGGILEFWAPYYAFYLLTFNWLAAGKRSAFWSDVYETIVCFPMAVAVTATLLKPFGRTFSVTPKGLSNHRVHVNWPVALPLLIAASMCAAGLIATLASNPWASMQADSTLMNMVWNAYNLALLSIALQGTIDVPQERRHLRFARSVPARLEVNGIQHETLTLDLSESGARFKLGTHLPAGAQATLTIKDAQLTAPVEVIAERGARGSVRVVFGELTVDQTRALTRYLFCRAGVWQGRCSTESRSLWDFLRTTVRLYPLCETRQTSVVKLR
ncbi:MAG TPA: glycosyltransferase [Planctomycetota bacterium]|nr:glycosyltransferase [Planctomycetota bacterium]